MTCIEFCWKHGVRRNGPLQMLPFGIRRKELSYKILFFSKIEIGFRFIWQDCIQPGPSFGEGENIDSINLLKKNTEVLQQCCHMTKNCVCTQFSHSHDVLLNGLPDVMRGLAPVVSSQSYVCLPSSVEKDKSEELDWTWRRGQASFFENLN